MSTYLDKEYTDYQHIQLQRVPFYIHIPGEEGKVMSEIAGQVDVKPTLLHLLGMDTSNDLSFGTDLFVDDRKPFVALRDGSFITDDYVYTKDQCYDRETGELIEEETNDETEVEGSACGPYVEQVEKELSYSDEIIFGDLFRFYDFKDK